MNLHHYLIAFSLVLLLVTTASLANSLPGESTSKEVAASDRLSVSELLSFDGFSKAFGKTYSSLVQRMTSMKYYIANLFKVFNSLVKYERREQDSYLGVNQMSDWSPEEVKKMYIPLAVLEEGIVGSDEINTTSTSEGNNKPGDRVKRDLTSTVMGLDNWRSCVKETGCADMIHIDHRGCLMKPRYQGNCGSCFVFATIALYEWIHCNKTGKHMPLSEQYVVDCGHRYGLNGCNGGNPMGVAEFVAACGLESRTKYPYQPRQNQCPYNRETPDKEMGQYRINEPRLKLRYPHEIISSLERSPLIVSVATYDDFHLYAGGVDDPVNCNPMQGHSMLLVGHGRENGQQYWILRNSFGENQGEKGYYRLKRAANCLMVSGFSHSPQAMSKKLDDQPFLMNENPDYNGNPVDEVREMFETMNDLDSFVAKLDN